MTKTTRATRGMQLAEKTLLGIIAGAAAAIGVVEIVLLVGRVISLASDRSLTVSGIPLLDFPAEQVAAASSLIESAQFDGLTLTAAGIPGSARALLIASAILGGLLTVGICAVVAWLCLRVFIGRPFVRSATWGIGIVAILVIAGAMGGALFKSIAHAEIVDALDLSDAGLPVFLATIDLAPLGWGLALAVIAGAFEIGQRMQRETEGLV